MHQREDPTGQILSEDLISNIVSLCGGFLRETELDSLVKLIESEVVKYYRTASSESNLLRIFNSLFDKVNFFFDAVKYPHHAEIFVAVAYNSNYLTDIVVRNPELLYQLFNPSYLFENIEQSKIRSEVKDGISRFKTFNAKVNYLKFVKRRAILKIGVNDILGNLELKDVTKQLSALASVLNAELFLLCYKEILAKYSVEADVKYALVGLGKLGGFELNYSSDVDFIIFYEKNYLIKTVNKEYHEILTESIQLFIKNASEITEKGFLYRTDFRLRPDGRNSPLCRTIEDYLKYYETRGEMWEKQMLIKTGFVGGDHDLYRQFFNYLQSYIFTAAFSVSPLEVIRRMKVNIEKHSHSKDDVKRFPGGIRDIEFAVQALQLLKGHEIIELRTGNTLEALIHLERNGIVSFEERTFISEGYIFYRKIEHYLQLMNDKQTHTIPSEGEVYAKLVNYLGLNSPAEFESKLKKFRIEIRKFYDSVVGAEEDSLEEKVNEVSEIEFRDRSKAERNLLFLRTGTGLLGQKGFDSRTIDLYNSFESNLMAFLKTAGSVDKVLENLTKLISSVKMTSIWYSEFKNHAFLNQILTLCQFAQKGIDNLCLDPSIGDLTLSRKAFTVSPESFDTSLNLNQFNAAISFQQALRLTDETEFSRNLSSFIDKKLSDFMRNSDVDEESYFVAGLGSFATEEMVFSSDLDLIAVSAEPDSNGELNSKLGHFLVNAKKLLNPCEVDFRLRPEGKHSPLVWDISGYENYLKSRAGVWEFQALTKLRFVFGNRPLFEKFRNIVHSRMKEIEPEALRTEVISMNKKIHANYGSQIQGAVNLKYSLGGKVDIDNIIQFLILKKPDIFMECHGLNNPKRLQILSENFSDITELGELSKIYMSLKSTELAIQNIFNVNKPNIPNDAEKQRILAHFFGMSFEELFKTTVDSLKKSRRYFTEIVGGKV